MGGSEERLGDGGERREWSWWRVGKEGGVEEGEGKKA